MGIGSTGISQASMTAMLSANASMKQAAVQGSAMKDMENRANVLKGEIKTDGGGSGRKEKELAGIDQRVEETKNSLMRTINRANAAVEEARAAEKEANKDKTTEKTTEKDDAKKKEKTGEKDETAEVTEKAGKDSDRIAYTASDAAASPEKRAPSYVQAGRDQTRVPGSALDVRA